MKTMHPYVTVALATAVGCATHGASQKKPTEAGAPGAAAITATAPADSRVNDVLARLDACKQVSSGLFKTDHEFEAKIPICSLHGALFWKADLDVDCDGERTPECNEVTDPWYQNQTSGKASDGKWLNASTLPFVVIPSRGDRFDYQAHGIELGNVVAVIYKGRLAFGVFADSGPEEIIGEASYAMAKSLGIDPDPENGGTLDEVIYIAFQGEAARSAPLEDHGKAVALGNSLLDTFLQQNP